MDLPPQKKQGQTEDLVRGRRLVKKGDLMLEMKAKAGGVWTVCVLLKCLKSVYKSSHV